MPEKKQKTTHVTMAGWEFKEESEVEEGDCWTDAVDWEAFKVPEGAGFTGALDGLLGNYLSLESQQRALGGVPSEPQSSSMGTPR